MRAASEWASLFKPHTGTSMKSFIVAQIRSEMLDELLTVLLNAKNMPVDLLTAKINQIAKKQEAAFGKVLAKKSVTLGNFGKLSLKTGK